MKITEKGLSCKLREIKVGSTFKIIGENHFYLKLNNTPNNNVLALYIEDESYVPLCCIRDDLDVMIANVTVEFNTLPF